MTNMKNIARFSVGMVSAILLNACASAPQGKYSPDKSYLQQQPATTITTSDSTDNKSKSNNKTDKQNQDMTYLPPLGVHKQEQRKAVDLTKLFSDSAKVQLTADDLPLKDYLHYVLGELLNVSYILGEQVKADNKTVTLNLQQDISQRKLFTISEQLLTERGYVIRFDEGIYYIHKAESAGAQGNVAYGYGKFVENVPNSSATIVQLVPFTFGMQTSLANTLKQIINIKANPDFQNNTIILQGKRKDIIRALEFINLMDQPTFKNRHIGVYKANFVSTDTLIKKLPALLKQEGISVSAQGQNDLAVSLVELDRIGRLVLFANSKQLIERVAFWAKQIDQTPSGNQLQYFIYYPQFARASDLGESLQPLISGGISTNVGSTVSAASQNKQQSKSSTSAANRVQSASGEDMTLVIDQRTNALIFNTTGDKYRQLHSLLKRLDVMPRQVILEMMVAEVKLTDDFNQGVEFKLTNSGDASNVGNFTLGGSKAGLSYALLGARGELKLNLSQTNTNINVLSRPSILVRDGVTANITVGDRIPTLGAIVTTDSTSSQSIVYLTTGLELKVKPTINARGVVIMEISQKTSDAGATSAALGGAPIVFERSLETEVVAESGQTIILGGLIRDSRTVSDTTVPFFSGIPLIGKLFDTNGDKGEKTELIIMVTPRIIESSDEWDDIKTKFESQLTQLKINQ